MYNIKTKECEKWRADMSIYMSIVSIPCLLKKNTNGWGEELFYYFCLPAMLTTVELLQGIVLDRYFIIARTGTITANELPWTIGNLQRRK